MTAARSSQELHREMELPESITARATLSGSEHGWSIVEFPSILAEAATHGFACIGGQFQFLLPDGTCAMYWLSADSTPRRTNELWQDYVLRSEQEVRATFDRICSETDFIHEALQWEFLRQKATLPDFDVLIDLHHSAVADGGACYVSTEILKGCCPVAGGLDVHAPVFAPDFGIDLPAMGLEERAQVLPEGGLQERQNGACSRAWTRARSVHDRRVRLLAPGNGCGGWNPKHWFQMWSTAVKPLTRAFRLFALQSFSERAPEAALKNRSKASRARGPKKQGRTSAGSVKVTRK